MSICYRRGHAQGFHEKPRAFGGTDSFARAHRAHRQAGRRGRGGAVPVLGQILLHYRGDASGGRRHVCGLASARRPRVCYVLRVSRARPPAQCSYLSQARWLGTSRNALPQLAWAHAHETLLWAGKRGSRHTFNYDLINSRNPSAQISSVWSIPSVPKKEKLHGYHPTQKPLRLVRRAILASSREGDLVFDPFCGSGTTGVAAKELGRFFVGV